MAEIAVGIDLGTSNSCVALARGSKVEVLPNAYGEGITPSVVGFQEGGAIAVGMPAKSNVIHDPSHTVSSAKRLIGRYFFSEEVKKAKAVFAYDIVEGPGHGVRIAVRDEQFSIPEISAMVLREMKTVAERHVGQEVTKAVITVPAYFNDNQRQATKDAGRIAGLEVLRLLNEPTAAALAYGFGRGLTQRVAVYDLGGGTFDISVLEIGKDVFEVLATCGDTYLGGDDFDDRMIDLLADEFQAREGINLRSDIFALEKLKVAAEVAKKGLSVDEQVEIRIPDVVQTEDGRSLSLERSLTQQDLGQLVMDLLQRTFKVCDEALQQAGIIARDLDGVILVGGPTRLPLVRSAVGDYFQQEPKTDVDPDEVVALGAAIHASSLVTDDEDEDADGAFLLDVTPLSLRIGVAGGLAETVIERNTPVPIEQTRTFTTFQDDQEQVKIRVFQGESRQAQGNELLGQFEFSGFKKAPRGEVRIEVTFEIDTNGIVHVTARDRETGESASTEITLSSGLSEDEIQSILEASNTDRVLEGEEPGAAEEAPDALAVLEAAPAAEPSTPVPGDTPEPFMPSNDRELTGEPTGDPLELADSASLETPPVAAPTPELDLAHGGELELGPEDLEEVLEDVDGAPDLEIDASPQGGAPAIEVDTVVSETEVEQDPAIDVASEEVAVDVIDTPEISVDVAASDAPEPDAPAGEAGLFEAAGTDLSQFGEIEDEER